AAWMHFPSSPPSKRAGCARLRPLELCADREVVGKHRPRLAAMHARARDVKAAHVDPVEPEERHHARKRARRAAVACDRNLAHAEAALENGARPVAPIIE